MKGVVIFDANVLYASTLRDTLIQLASEGVCEARWTPQIHDEWTRNVLKNRPDIPARDLARTRRLMDLHVPRALVAGHEHLIPTLQMPDENDRHVLAAAIHCGAEFIVTFNLKDFPALILAEHEIQAVAPDEFLIQLFASNQSEVIAALQAQRSRMKNPPQTRAQFLETLARQRLPQFVAALEPFQNQL